MKRGHLYHDLSSPAKRTRHALGINKRTFRRWTKVHQGEKNKKRAGRKYHFDNFDKDIVHREILKLFEERELFTLRRLKLRLQEHRELNISKS